MTLQRQLLLLTLGSVAAVSGLTVASLRLRTFPALMTEFRKELSPAPFLLQRRQRLQDLGQMAHIFASDALVNRVIRAQPGRSYVEAVAALSAADLKRPSIEQRARLKPLREKDLFQLKEMSERLFLNYDNPPDASQTLEACADLCLVVDVNGVVLIQLSSVGDRKYQMHSREISEPQELLFVDPPFAKAAFKNVDAEANRSVAGCFSYGSNFYQGVALDLPLGTGLVVLADRIDAHLAAMAAQSCGRASQALFYDPAHSRVLASSQAELAAPLANASWPLGDGQVELRGEVWQSLSLPLQTESGADLRLVLLKPNAVLYQVVQSQWHILAGILAGVTGLVLAISGWLSNSVGRPVQQLALGLGKVGKGELEIQLLPEGPGELREAARAFNQMVDDLKEKSTLENLVTRLEELRHQADLSDEHVRQQTQFGPYVVTERLGAGGMATVYKALPLATLAEADRVAIKIVHRQFAEDANYQARLRREFEVLHSLSHPGIVKVLEFGNLNGILWLAMEFVSGLLLSERLKKGPLALAEFRLALEQVTNALIHAHRGGVIHRDLKSDNMMVTQDGIKVMDFGLATGSEFAHLTATGVAMGTPAYVAPEQVSGGVVDGRADQYSLGIVFFEMLTGQQPFQAAEPMALIQLQLSAQPPEPDLYRPEIPGAWSRVLLRMLEKSPDQRFPDLESCRQAWNQAFG